MTHPLQPNQKPDLTTTVYVDYPRYKINKEGVKKVVNSADEEKALGEGWYNNRFDAGILPRPGEELPAASESETSEAESESVGDEDLQGSETESADDEGSENADETASESESDESETGKKKKKKKK